MSVIEGLLVYDIELETNVKVIKEAVFSSTIGHKRWKLLGLTLFKNRYDEKIGKVEFIDEDGLKSTAIGFNKKEKK